MKTYSQNRTVGQAYGSQKLDHNRGMEMPRSSVQQPESETRVFFSLKVTRYLCNNVFFSSS